MIEYDFSLLVNNTNKGRNWGYTQTNEAWAEFIGKEHHRRHHPSGVASVTLASGANGYFPYPQAQEDVPWFINNWLNTGIFYDLNDPANEINDALSGYSINNMYYSFNPNTAGFCRWRTSFINRNPTINQTNLNNLMRIQNGWNGNCY